MARNGMQARKYGALIPAVLLAVCSCDSGPDLTDGEVQALVAWLSCEKCINNELDNASAVGPDAISYLDEVLTEVPSEWLATLRIRYGRIAAGRNPTDSADYVDRFLGNSIARFQRRSAELIGKFPNEPTAVQALDDAANEAAARGYRPDVIQAIHRARMGATVPGFGGDLSATSAAFLDTIWVTQENGVQWDGDEFVEMHGAPFPNDVAVGFRGGPSGRDSLGVVAGAPVGRYVLSISNIGSGQDTRSAELTVTSFPAARVTSIPDVTAGPFPLTFIRSLTFVTARPDTIHYFKFRPTTATDVSATVEWTDGSQVDLIFDACRNRTIPGLNPLEVMGTVVDETGVPLEGVQVRLEGTSLATLTSNLGEFTIPGVPASWTGTLRAIRIGFAPFTRPAREGDGHHWIVLNATGVPSVFSPIVNQSNSPNSLSGNIPAGACRLLGIHKRDGGALSTVIRLRITSP